ncbi:MAG: 1-acyl-sn-glycerol-3-phosphate acyltransferase [Leptospiraceae bacterium]|nr:1-acyl-sn-glycerol-3-phosphate acyltransferase [Leptospiraceae bacterium]
MKQTKPFWLDYNHPGKKPLPLWLFHVVLKPLMLLRYRIKVEGLDHIPLDGSLLVLAKHQRFEDIPLGYLFALAKRRKDVWCLMKHTLGGGYLTSLGGISINRHDPHKSKADLKLCRAVLDHQQLLALFPEQTLYPGNMGRGKLPGFRFITERTGSGPLQVICIGYEYKRTPFYRRTAVTMRLGPVSTFESGKTETAGFFHERMLELAGLCNLEYPYGSANE